MLACEADARGRGEALRAQAYPQAHYLSRAAQAARSVKLEPAELATLEGAAIGERLRRLRLAAVRAAAPASA
jgi:tRNA nucleotidyltransferase (CCA-adding enzyme)